MVEVILNGIKCKVKKGTNIITVASANCVNIPTLCNGKPRCNDSKNQCGVCVVEVTLEGNNILLPSCCTPVTDKMIINTLSKNVLNARTNKIRNLSSW